MKLLKNLSLQFIGLTNTITRYPLAAIFLLSSTIANSILIGSNNNQGIEYYMISFLMGALISIVLQMLYERFSTKDYERIIYIVVAAVATLGYYLFIQARSFNQEITIKSFALSFILLIAFLWIPSINSKYSFNETFMATLKAFFVALIFSGVIFIGVSAIVFAIDFLIVSIDSEIYGHSANIIFNLFAPLYLLSMIPVYPGKLQIDSKRNDLTSSEEVIQKAATASKFMENLISYVVIPLTAIFTIILLLYLITNITGRFWTDNLLEPMLVAYSITVIIVYLLASRLDNKFTRYFRKIFPKVLIPIVLFQTLSSILKINDTGITYGRYYVIIFGVFATIAAILFCIVPVKKNGIIAPIIIILTLLSIIPPVDAFTVSRNNQTNRLKDALVRNEMLDGDNIVPNPSATEEDKKLIISSLSYLRSIDRIDDISWLKDYQDNRNFEKAFGFSEYGHVGKDYTNIYLNLNQNTPIPIEGYEYILNIGLYSDNYDQEFDFTKDDKVYGLKVRNLIDEEPVILLTKDEDNLIQYDINDIFARYSDEYNNTSRDMTLEEATFTTENEQAILTLIAHNVNINQWSDNTDQNAQIMVLIKIK